MAHDERAVLRVEGKDDKYVIENLLSRHGIDRGVVDIKWSKRGDDEGGGRDQLLDGMRLAVTTSTSTAVGFVLDADDAPGNRWRGVRARLGGVGLELPKEIPEGGFVGDAPAFRARVGVWLMPDNRGAGALEEFLRGLVDDKDPLLELAETSTTSASERGATFRDTHRRKAVLHTWLAWQQRPGLPYGLAIRARYFHHDSPAALAFVEWFRRVFAPTAT